jgi:hydroxyacylglutathione hydrolase
MDTMDFEKHPRGRSMKIHGRRVLSLIATVAAVSVAITPLRVCAQISSFVPGVMPEEWQHGGPDCSEVPQDFQVHKYNDNFYILRESGCVHYEQPFLYLLFGQNKAILFDTGAGNNTDPTTGRVPNVLAAVDFVINQWLARNNKQSITLVVTHLHSHFDHTWGDFQFQNRPNTLFVPPGSVPALQSFFGIPRWPRQIVQYDLGQRILDIIPIPGHDPTHIAVYDRQTGVLLTGDHLYPGRLYVNSGWDEYAESTQRLVDFTKEKAVAHVMGTHIEQRGPYVDYPLGTHYTPDETDLQLGRAHLLELLEGTKARTSTGEIVQKAFRDFTICGPYPSCNPVNK